MLVKALAVIFVIASDYPSGFDKMQLLRNYNRRRGIF